MTDIPAWRRYLPVVTSALSWLNNPEALAAFLSSLANDAPALSKAFARVRAGEVLARALQGQAGPELRSMGQDLTAQLGPVLMTAVLAAAQAAKR